MTSAPVAVAFARAADALRGHLAVEERDAEDVADAWAPAAPLARDDALDESAPVRTSEPSAGKTKASATPVAAGPGEDRLGRDRLGLAGNEDRESVRAGGDDRGLRGRAGAGRRSGERPGDQEQCEQPRVDAPTLSGSGETMRRSIENENRFQLFSPRGIRASHFPPASARQRSVSPSCVRWPSRPGSFTVAELHDRARQFEPRLGLATTYRTVELLRADGGVHPLVAKGGRRTSAAVPSTTTTSSVRAAAASRRRSSAPRRRGGAAAPPWVSPRGARARHVRHLQALRVNWIAIPLAGVTVVSTLVGALLGSGWRAS